MPHESAPVLLERQEEVDLVASALREALNGRGRLLLVEAPPGLGKTALLHVAGELACDRGFLTLPSRASELERDFPFGVIRQMLEPVLSRAAPDERSRLTSGAAALAARALDPSAAAPPPPGDAIFPVLHGLYWLVANLAEKRPLALLVDDVQWADVASLRFLAFLAGRLGEIPVALLAATRPVTSEQEEPPVLASLMASPGALRARPAPLSIDATSSLAERMLAAPVEAQFARACHTATAGNPFFLEELLRDLRHRGVVPRDDQSNRISGVGPRTVSRAVMLRLERLGPGALAVARAIAVLGEAAGDHEMSALAGLGADDSQRAADALVRASILTEADGRFGFVHPIVRSAVYADVAPGDRGRAHGEAAALLLARGGAPEDVATHLLLARPGGVEGAAQALQTAARHALARGAPEAAVSYLRRALDEPQDDTARSALLLQLGLSDLTARGPAAVATLRAAAEQATVPEHQVVATVVLGRLLALAGTPRPVAELLVEALARFEHVPPLAYAFGSELLVLANVDPAAAEFARPQLAAVRAEGLGRPPDGSARRRRRAGLAIDALRRNLPAEEVAALARAALEEDLRIFDEEGVESPLPYSPANALMGCGHLDEALQAYGGALERATAQGSYLGFGIASMFRALARQRAGDLAAAETDAAAIVERGAEFPFSLAFARAVLTEVAVERGDLAAGLEHLEQGGVAAVPEQAPFFPMLRFARGRLALAQAQPAAALADFLAAGDVLERWELSCPGYIPWRSAASLAALLLGRPEEARSLAAAELRAAREFGAAPAVGIALRAAGLAAVEKEQPDLLSESVRVLERSQARLEHARSLVEFGGWLRRNGQRARARESLAEGLDLAMRCAATALAERARVELAAAGARPRRVYRSGVESLTPSERRVAELAAEGLSTPQIAQSLFITRKTVEKHLSHAYRKLDIGSRLELPRALAGAEDPRAATWAGSAGS